MTTQAAGDYMRVYRLLARYEEAFAMLDSQNPVLLDKARRIITDLVEQARAMYQEFSSTPARWQEALDSGAIGGLQPFVRYFVEPGETFGLYVPDSDLLTERAVEAYQCAYS